MYYKISLKALFLHCQETTSKLYNQFGPGRATIIPMHEFIHGIAQTNQAIAGAGIEFDETKRHF
jgi:hypothetical protein